MFKLYVVIRFDDVATQQYNIRVLFLHRTGTSLCDFASCDVKGFHAGW
jgi:hypothetical protein